jgi:hypothetical protein
MPEAWNLQEPWFLARSQKEHLEGGSHREAGAHALGRLLVVWWQIETQETILARLPAGRRNPSRCPYPSKDSMTGQA